MGVPVYVNELLVVVMGGLFVLPTVVRLVLDVAASRSRNFSHIPHRNLNVFVTLVRGGFVAGAYFITASANHVAAAAVTYGAVFVIGVLMRIFSHTAYRLFVDAETGLITWTHLMRPWWSKKTQVRYIDDVGTINYTRGAELYLFGLAKLQRLETSTYNGQQLSSGHFGEKALHHLRDSFNEYREAFFRHDTDEGREFRKRFKEVLEEKLAPARLRERERRVSAAARKTNRRIESSKTQGDKQASAEEKRRKKLDDKFAD